MSSIRSEYEKILTSLKVEMDECSKINGSEQSIEKCFAIAIKHWEQLKLFVSHHAFESEDDEIEFFKKMKPTLISEIEYYSLLNQASLFCPFKKSEQFSYWLKEQQRLEGFKKANEEFYKYCVLGKNDKDREYFLMSSEVGKQMCFYDNSGMLQTSHDYMVAKLWALDRYWNYIESRLHSKG